MLHVDLDKGLRQHLMHTNPVGFHEKVHCHNTLSNLETQHSCLKNETSVQGLY